VGGGSDGVLSRGLRDASAPVLVLVPALVSMARPSHIALILVVAVTGSLAAVAVGSVLSGWAIASAAVVLVLVSASVHYVNEWADHETDALTTRTPFSGGSGTLPETSLPRRIALLAGIATAALASLAALAALLAGVLTVTASVLLLLGGLLGWSYSMPLLALGWRGLGELTNALAGGLVLPLYGYAVVADEVPLAMVLAFVPFAALDFSNLLATTWPDRRADAAVGKLTLATRWPASRLRVAHALAAASCVGLLAALTVAAVIPLPVGVAGLAAVPLIVWGLVRYTRQESPLPTVAAMLALALLLLVGWAIAAAAP
jgi:1,4-dihydroxy-2-naphthoate polyprenyltransferase